MTNGDHGRATLRDKSAGQAWVRCLWWGHSARLEEIYTIFEGTSEIQRLVIARAISGMRIR
jgi:alkylation response protein AidB-like acyl-CoA dehydrogenase